MSDIEQVWVVAYYGEDPEGYADHIGGIFEEEMTARFTVSGLVTLGHKEWACMYPLPFDMVLPVEPVDTNAIYLVKDIYNEGEFVWIDGEGYRE
jgi:hypothetical protein